jgi:hypothetical protein
VSFYQLYRNERRDLQHKLFADLPLEELSQTHLDNAERVQDLDIIGTARFIWSVWQWEKVTAGTLAPRLVECLDHRLARQDYVVLRQLNLGEVAWLLALKFAPTTTHRWLAHLDYAELAERSGNVGLGTVKNFLQKAKQAGIDKAKLRAFTDGLDFKALGERSRDARLATVRVFLQLATQAGVEKAALRAFAEELDFKALGERSREVGLATVMTFLQKAKQAGVDKAKLRAFAKGLDFKALGEQSQDVGFASIEVFLRKVSQIGVTH